LIRDIKKRYLDGLTPFPKIPIKAILKKLKGQLLYIELDLDAIGVIFVSISSKENFKF